MPSTAVKLAAAAVAAAVVAAVVAAGEHLTVQGQQLDWQTEQWGAVGAQPQESFLQLPTESGGSLTGQRA